MHFHMINNYLYNYHQLTLQISRYNSIVCVQCSPLPVLSPPPLPPSLPFNSRLHAQISGEPNPPHDISVDADGLTLVASWDEPFSLEGEELSYAVSITNTATGAQREVNVTTTRYVLHEPIGERDCAEYEFTVFSKNNYSKSRNGVTGRDHIPTGNNDVMNEYSDNTFNLVLRLPSQ